MQTFDSLLTHAKIHPYPETRSSRAVANMEARGSEGPTRWGLLRMEGPPVVPLRHYPISASQVVAVLEAHPELGPDRWGLVGMSGPPLVPLGSD